MDGPAIAVVVGSSGGFTTSEPLTRGWSDALHSTICGFGCPQEFHHDSGGSATGRTEGTQAVEDWGLAPLVTNLMAFLGVKLVTASAISAEIGNFARFEKAGSFMAFTGLVPSEHSSGGSRKQGGITKTGNRHVRRLLVEAAWHSYDARPGGSAELHKRRAGGPQEIIDVAEKARLRLRKKAARLRAAHKPPNKITTALARELAGFLWAAAQTTHCPEAA